ncbi:MAG: cupin domain-containing protein [Armatimonadetes bacterium]|nr:cupin domain-containing protein [Anaerolineae bacterium]
MANNTPRVAIKRWQGAQHPSFQNISQLMQADNLRPYMWTNLPNHRYAIRSHGYDKVLYVIDGTLELLLPDTNEQVKLRAGDRADIPAGVRHGTIVGINGAKCVEASKSNRRALQK